MLTFACPVCCAPELEFSRTQALQKCDNYYIIILFFILFFIILINVNLYLISLIHFVFVLTMTVCV